MGEFDLSLIEEFRSRHSLYDRNSLQFKDKLYNAGQWQEISNKLGYDVSILKDRMLQLRNRYNLEKRRMEQLRDEVPGKYHESPWPLYDSLQFLSGHIKARRRYKSILPIASLKEDSQMNDSGNDYSALGPDDSALADDGEKEEEDMHSGGAQPFPNGLFTVKVEDNCSEEPEPESENETESHRTGDNSHFADNPYVMTEIHSPNNEYRQQMQRQQQLQQQHIQQQQQHQQLLQLRQQQRLAQAAAAAQSQILPTRIIKRNTNNHNDLENHQMSRLSSTSLSGGGGGGGAAAGVKRHYDDNNGPAAKHQRLSPRENKYNAFGNFISSSLLDLPQKMALELVEKFTSDIVKALTMKMENAEAAAAAAASSSNEDGDGGGHHNRHSQNSEQ